jgi:hypothetical protein
MSTLQANLGVDDQIFLEHRLIVIAVNRRAAYLTPFAASS